MSEEQNNVPKLLRSKISASWRWIFTLPPGITLIAHLSLLFTLGPVGQWFRDHWFPLTRTAWQWVADLISYDIPTDIKDSLSALLFFLPILFVPERYATWGPNNWSPFDRARLSLMLALATMILLASAPFGSMLQTADIGFDSLAAWIAETTPWVYALIALLVTLVLFWDSLIIVRDTAALRKNGDPLRKGAKRDAHYFLLAPPLLLTAIVLFAVVLDRHSIDATNKTFTDQSSLFWVTIIIFLIYDGMTVTFFAKPGPSPREPGDVPGFLHDPDRLFLASLTILAGLVVLALGFAAWFQQWLVTALLVILTMLVLYVGIRKPGWMIAIAVSVFGLLLAALFVQVFDWVRIWLEGRSQAAAATS